MVDAERITAAFVAESIRTLETMRGKIVNCLGQLSEEDVNWRPFAGANSIANIVTHLCGNVGQWIIAAVGGGPANRDRPGEFSQELRATPAELLGRIEETVRQANEAIAGVTAERALSPLKIQGFDTHVLGAVMHAVTHFEGHTHQIVYVTRLRLGDRYRFKWVPATAEQVSGKK